MPNETTKLLPTTKLNQTFKVLECYTQLSCQLRREYPRRIQIRCNAVIYSMGIKGQLKWFTWLQLSLNVLKLFTEFSDSLQIGHGLSMVHVMVDPANTMGPLNEL